MKRLGRIVPSDDDHKGAHLLSNPFDVVDVLASLSTADRLQQLALRKANLVSKIDDWNLPAGSPMHFYCVSCGWLAGVLPELSWAEPPRLCPECSALKLIGALASA